MKFHLQIYIRCIDSLVLNAWVVLDFVMGVFFFSGSDVCSIFYGFEFFNRDADVVVCGSSSLFFFVLHVCDLLTAGAADIFFSAIFAVC